MNLLRKLVSMLLGPPQPKAKRVAETSQLFPSLKYWPHLVTMEETNILEDSNAFMSSRLNKGGSLHWKLKTLTWNLRKILFSSVTAPPPPRPSYTHSQENSRTTHNLLCLQAIGRSLLISFQISKITFLQQFCLANILTTCYVYSLQFCVTFGLPV